MARLSALLLRMAGWKLNVTVPDYEKVIICVAPHTSNWDFILGKLAYWAIGRKAGFLMKKAWFVWPLGYFFRALGGIAVDRRGGQSLVQALVNKFNASTQMAMAITPEGTRSRVTQWRTGFLHIAIQANVPIVLGAIDAATKTIHLERTFIPSGNIDTDLKEIKEYYRQFTGIIPENFSAE